MQDRLKRYVDDHREALDCYVPRESLWDGVDERLHGRRHSMRWQRLAIAASLLLALSTGAWIFLTNRERSQSGTVAESQPQQQQLGETEVYFTALLQMKDAELEQYCGPQPELCREFEQDIETLNEAYRRLKAEYATAADKHAVLRAMAANLQLQVQLIGRQLQIMESVQQKKDVFKTT